MSCRTVGLDVEIAALAELIARLRQRGATLIAADFVKTDANLLCRDLFARCGFTEIAGAWTLPHDQKPSVPDFIALTIG